MTEDLTAKGSTKDYCSVDTADGHHLVSHIGGTLARLAVDRCSMCGWIDHDDIIRQLQTSGLALVTVAWLERQLHAVRYMLGPEAFVAVPTGQLSIYDPSVLRTSVPVLLGVIDTAHMGGWTAVPAEPDDRGADNA